MRRRGTNGWLATGRLVSMLGAMVVLLGGGALAEGLVCGVREPRGGVAAWLGGGADCSISTSNPTADYDPSSLYTIPVVVHVIMDNACSQGAMTDDRVESQIEILNEDFLALPGTNGAAGVDGQIQFVLASLDPDGNPTTGITRTCNTTWFNDDDPYYDTLAWDPSRYLNLYTNTASGARGYVPFLPAESGGAMVGTNADRVVINHLAFGRNGPFPPHDQGRTVTHEVGHFLGLFHPYFNGCGTASAPGCYSTGDLLCDTPPDATSHDLCPVGATSCGGVLVPIENYMELTDDTCMTGFTLEQVRRMRCTLESFRPGLFALGGGLFADGFESGGTGQWSAVAP